MTQIGLLILGKESELTFIDCEDKSVTVKKPIEKIVAVTVGTAEATKIFKAQDKVVGAGEYVNEDKVFFPELSKLPCVGSWYTGLDYEKIFELNPDIVVTYAYYTPELEESLELVGITAVRLDFYTETLLEDIKKFGYILDKEDEAEEFIDFYEECLNPIKEKTETLPEEAKPRVYYEFYFDYTTAYSIWNMLITTAGGIDVAADLSEGYESVIVDPEWVVDQNPAIIVRNTFYASIGYEGDDPSKMKSEWEAILNRPELAGVTAIEDESVFVTSYEITDTFRSFVGIAYMAKWFHPELFEDLDPKAIHQEYLTKFHGLDFDVYKHGVFVYHPELHPDGR